MVLLGNVGNAEKGYSKSSRESVSSLANQYQLGSRSIRLNHKERYSTFINLCQ